MRVSFRAYYRKQLSDKDSENALLKTQLDIYTKQSQAHKEAEKLEPEKDKYWLAAKSLISGHPAILSAFLDLTDKQYIKTAWSPLEDPWKWEGLHSPDSYELEKRNAYQFLWNEGYISSYADNGYGDYGLSSYDFAKKVRESYELIRKQP